MEAITPAPRNPERTFLQTQIYANGYMASTLSGISKTFNVVLSWKLFDASSELKLEECGKHFRRTQLRLQLFHDLVKLQRFVVAKHAHDPSFSRRQGSFL